MSGFAEPADMDFAAQLVVPDGREALRFDPRYRLAQLPLVQPDHPLAQMADPAGRYRAGLRDVAHSLVIGVDGQRLAESPAILALRDRLLAVGVGPKIAWKMEERRRGLLHATLCGTLPFRPPAPFPDRLRNELTALAPFRFQLRGLFAGRFNTGRLYLCLYPELRGDAPATDAMTQVMGLPPNRLLLCGYLSLTDELTPQEAGRLGQVIRESHDTVFDTQICAALKVLESQDDLVLRSRVVERIALGSGRV